MVSPVHGDYRRLQAEIPLSDLFKFAEPALKSWCLKVESCSSAAKRSRLTARSRYSFSIFMGRRVPALSHLVPSSEPNRSRQRCRWAATAAFKREEMAVNKPAGDNARKGAVKERTQLKIKLGGATAFT
jgi:hypothetical protein